MGSMSEQLTPERLAELRVEVESLGYYELFEHIDALTAERDAALAQAIEPTRDALVAVLALRGALEGVQGLAPLITRCMPKDAPSLAEVWADVDRVLADTAQAAAEYRARIEREAVEAFAAWLDAETEGMTEAGAQWLAEREAKG